MERVTRLSQLERHDVVRWCEQIISGRPVTMRRGIVLNVTSKGGVLLYVTSGHTKGLTGRKHWVPLARIWAKTGETRQPPSGIEWVTTPGATTQQGGARKLGLLPRQS